MVRTENCEDSILEYTVSESGMRFTVKTYAGLFEW